MGGGRVHGTAPGAVAGRQRAGPGTTGRRDRGWEAHLTPKTAWILVEEGTPQANDKEAWGGSGSVPSALRVNPTPPPEETQREAPAGTPGGSCMAGTDRLMSKLWEVKSMTVVALSVAPDGHSVMVELPDSSQDQLRALCRLIGCAAVVAVVVEPDLLIWLDDNHIDPVAPLNPVASTLAASVTGRADIQGVAVFTGSAEKLITGSAEKHGAITSLPARWWNLVFRAGAVAPPPDPTLG